MPYQILFTKQAAKDIKTLSPKQKNKLQVILTEIIANDPYQGKKLLGELANNYSYRLDLKNRIVYSIDKKKNQIFVKRAHTHYGE